MKNNLHLVPLLVFVCLFSCHRQTNKVATSEPTEASSTAVTASQEQPFYWDFDLLWSVAKALPDASRIGDFGLTTSLDRVRDSYNKSSERNYLYWYGEDKEGDPCSSSMYCYKYNGLDKLLVVYQITCRVGDRNYDQDLAFDYDLRKETMTAVALPIQPLGFKDFFDGILLADQTTSKMLAYEAEGEVIYSFGNEGYDLLTFFEIPSEAYLPDFEMGLSDRENRLVFDWDGASFVHQPEKDLLGYSIYEDGFCSMDFGTEIPQQLDGFEIERQIVMAEGEEQVKYAITKDGVLVMELEPAYDFKTKAFTNTIETINIYSDRYQTFGDFHVGSKFSEVMDTYSDYATAVLTADGRLMVDIEGWQFMFDPADYNGKLPEVTSGEGAFILAPTIKPEAEVKMIRLYSIAG